MDWSRQHVVITGGSSGIGLAIAEAVARRGAHSTLLARGGERLANAAQQVRAAGRGRDTNVAIVSVDVSDRQATTDAFARIAGDIGAVDILITSAGITRPGRFLELDDEVFTAMIEVDYYGTLWPIRAVAPAMVERGRGSIVGISSAAALVGIYGYSAYGAAKFAVRGLLESLRTELAPHGVHVACAYPPDVDTPMFTDEAPLRPAETAAISGTIKPLPARRVAEAVVRGIERRKAEIYADPLTRAMARTATAFPAVYRKGFDRVVRGVGRPRRGSERSNFPDGGGL